MPDFLPDVAEPKAGKNPMHLDIRVDSREHFDRLVGMGATILERFQELTVMADPEGNEFCVIGVRPP